MKIIVTGGASSIGSHLIDRFIILGHRVAVGDDLTAGFRRSLNPKARFYEEDIRNTTRIREILHREEPEIVCHRAAVAEVVKSVRDPMPNLQATMALPRRPLRQAFLIIRRSMREKVAFSERGGCSLLEPCCRIPACRISSKPRGTLLAPTRRFWLVSSWASRPSSARP